MGSDMSAYEKLKDETLNRLSALEKTHMESYSQFQSLQRDHNSLHKDMLRSRNDNASLMKRIKDLEGRQEQLVNENDELRQMLNTEGNASESSTDASVLFKRIDDIEEKLTHGPQSKNHVELKHTGALVLGERITLNRCFKVMRKGGSFNTSTCMLNPQIEGSYVIHVVFRQYGVGKLRVFANGASGLDIYLGKTEEPDDISSTLRVWKLRKGEKVTFQISLEKGNATLRWCNLYTWMF